MFADEVCGDSQPLFEVADSADGFQTIFSLDLFNEFSGLGFTLGKTNH